MDERRRRRVERMAEIKDVILTKRVILYNPADIVQNSAIVQNSITYLDLALLKDYVVFPGPLGSEGPFFTHSDETIITEEKFRKILAKRRRLLYTWHLDLPRGREGSLRRNIPLERTPNEGRINVDDNFYNDVILSIIHRACMGECKFKALRWYLTCGYLDSSVFERTPLPIMNHCLDCMHRKLDDPEFVNCCLRKLNVVGLLDSEGTLKLKRFKNLAYHIHRAAQNDATVVWDAFVRFSISILRVGFLREVLKYQAALSFTVELFSFYYDCILLRRGTNVVVATSPAVSGQRNTLLIQVFWLFLQRAERPNASSQFLRLMWKSVPDSLLSFREITTIFAQGFSASEVADAYNFYCEVVGAPVVERLSDSVVEPRRLKHYCRTKIRRTLEEAGNIIPEGIKELRMWGNKCPKTLKIYLNLGE